MTPKARHIARPEVIVDITAVSRVTSEGWGIQQPSDLNRPDVTLHRRDLIRDGTGSVRPDSATNMACQQQISGWPRLLLVAATK